MSWTIHQANAAEARLLRGRRKGVAAEPVTDERKLHNQIIEECKRRGWIAFHGSMAHSTFRTPGEPDFVILRDNGQVVLIECKTRDGKLSTAQLGIAAWAKRLGHTVHVVRSFEEFLSI